ncbi:acyl carrier protein [Mycoplasma sp. P36-A1]|uniref:acyl carrier protein n=1 Tax=Mycoplasma sp. P36-A1 TaxID=3252900 RepID=UPI003C2E3FA2
MNTKVKEIIGDILDLEVSEISDTANILDDLGADSIAVMEIVMELETEYDIEVDTADIPSLKTVTDIITYIESK